MISPRSHIYRLVLLLLIGGAGFFWIKGFFVPDTWNSKLFYRVGALEDLKHLPMRHGGNEACSSSGCHADQQQASHQSRFAALARGKHKGLACEDCHGPLSRHARNGKKIAAARIVREGKLCLGCHAPLITRPEKFPQFDEDAIGHWYFDVGKDAICQKCHDPHEPRYMAVSRTQDGEIQKKDEKTDKESNSEPQTAETR